MTILQSTMKRKRRSGRRKETCEGTIEERTGMVFVVVVVALLFYVHGKHLRSCRDGQLT